MLPNRSWQDYHTLRFNFLKTLIAFIVKWFGAWPKFSLIHDKFLGRYAKRFFYQINISFPYFFSKSVHGFLTTHCVQNRVKNTWLNSRTLQDVLNTYCWIHSTYTIPSAFWKRIGFDVAHPGVDKTQVLYKQKAQHWHSLAIVFTNRVFTLFPTKFNHSDFFYFFVIVLVWRNNFQPKSLFIIILGQASYRDVKTKWTIKF